MGGLFGDAIIPGFTVIDYECDFFGFLFLYSVLYLQIIQYSFTKSIASAIGTDFRRLEYWASLVKMLAGIVFMTFRLNVDKKNVPLCSLQPLKMSLRRMTQRERH